MITRRTDSGLLHFQEAEALPEGTPDFIDNYYRSKGRANLKFLSKFQNSAQDRLKAIAEEHIAKDLTFIGIHNRRTVIQDMTITITKTKAKNIPWLQDYSSHMKNLYNVDHSFAPEYFYSAMDYFREEFPNPVFIYVSDDMAWGREKLEDRHRDLYFEGDILFVFI